MKNYTITVNGNVYDVTVEENDGATAMPQMPKPPVKAAPVAPKAPAAPTGSAGAIKVNAPMPGKILEIKANAGTAVKKGQVILLLEAMKMENEVVAPEDGTIASINVSAGDSVEAGAVLATLN
ncbi:MAG: acetyl-CoA carboxylase biotin carboxyl carrier protein subunit [Acetatifactor sp.]|nr:acetyl-CoA carboxylase biotin carboxyl carrier protein subunit [Acetatifactor sp.]